MTSILIHEIPVAVRDLERRLRTVLAELDSDEARHLAGRLVVLDRRQPRLVLTGQYSSGKSTLVKALTDGEAAVTITADYATSSIEEYDWDGVVRLVDTPGTQAGVATHDQLAEDAVAGADLVLFVVTPELFDDAAVANLRHIADDLGKSESLLVVLTQANTMDADPGIRQEAADNALGGGRRANLIECDAQDYLTGLAMPEGERRRKYADLSNMSALKNAINTLTERSGQIAVERQPLDAIAATATEAKSLLAVDDPTEKAALALLAQQRRALTTRRLRIETQLDDLTVRFTGKARAAAEQYGTDIDDLDRSGVKTDAPARHEAGERLRQALNTAKDELNHQAKAMTEVQVDDLASEVREIGAGPLAQVILTAEDKASLPRDWAPSIGAKRGRNGRQGHSSIPPWYRQVSDWTQTFTQRWGAGTGKGIAGSSGSAGHQIVLDVGHAFGYKFDPWQAVRIADRLGRVVKIAGPLVAIGGELWDEARELRAERRREARHRSIVTTVVAAADSIAHDVKTDMRQALDRVFAPALGDIDHTVAVIDKAASGRNAIRAELVQISDSCTNLENLEHPITPLAPGQV